LQLTESYRAQQARLSRLDQQLDQARQDLDAALALVAPGEQSPSLSFAWTRAEALLAATQQQQQRHASLVTVEQENERRLSEDAAAVHSLSVELAESQAEWQALLQELGIDEHADADEAFAVVQKMDELVQVLQNAESIRQRLQGIDADAERFAVDVRAVSQPLEIEGSTLPAQVIALGQRLEAARTARDQRSSLEHQLEDRRLQAERAQSELRQAELQLDDLCQQAGHVSRDHLAEVIDRTERHRANHLARRQIEEQLVQFTGGASVAEFADEALTLNVDALPIELEGLQQQQAHLEATLQGVNQEIGRVRAELGRMRGQGDAADQANQVQSQIADLQAEIRRYAVLRLSAAVLQQGIERYRDRHQGPLLSRASELFAQLTVGSFSGLRSDVNDNGVAILVGVRPDGRLIEVEGMSDGACDQLYLALRIAGLEAWLEHHEPLPFIVDDILVNFDDERAAAALQLLCNLSQRTQVLFFTHHQRLIDLAVEQLPRDRFAVHHLASSAASEGVNG
jgi:uncharacterized protein YhaN